MKAAPLLDGRLAAFLLAAGTLNGLVFRIVEAGKDAGYDAPLDFFGVSPFELLIGGVGVRLLWTSGAALERVGPAAIILYMLLMLWPSSLVAWLLVSAFGLAIAVRGAAAARAGALLFAALGMWEVWSAVIEPMASKNLLALDAGAVAAVLSRLRDDVVQIGNVVGAANGHRIVVLVGCSTAHFLPLALLGAAALLLARDGRMGRTAFVGLAVLAAALVTANLIRLTLMAWSSSYYHAVHGPTGALVFDSLTSLMIVAAALVIPAGRAEGRA